MRNILSLEGFPKFLLVQTVCSLMKMQADLYVGNEQRQHFLEFAGNGHG